MKDDGAFPTVLAAHSGLLLFLALVAFRLVSNASRRTSCAALWDRCGIISVNGAVQYACLNSEW